MAARLHPLHWAERDPQRPAWVFPATDQIVSYGELMERAMRGARLLRALGCRTGDGFALLCENRPFSLAIYWAAQLSGLYFTPISVQFKAREVGHILRDCGASVVVYAEEQSGKLDGAPQTHQFTVDAFWAAAESFEATLIPDACEGAEMLYSSGTTGQPKGVRATKPGAALGTTSELFRRRLALHQLDENTTYLSTAPLYHSAPLRYNAMTLRAGGTSVIMDRFDAAGALALLEQQHISHSQWVPTMFVRLLRLPEAVRHGYDLSSHRVAIHAAAPCPVAIKEAMINWWGPILYEYYSGTEGNGQTAISSQEWLNHKGSVGQPILGEVKILGDDDEELPAGTTGRVFFAGGPRFEYLNDADKTREAYSKQGYSTLGDIGHLDADGYLYLTDRASHMIITGGVNVYPREVEDVLVEHPAVLDAAVFGVPDEEFGERVQAAVELTPGSELHAQDLISFCRSRLAHLKCPRTVSVVDQLPRHATGKLYKQPLIERFSRPQ